MFIMSQFFVVYFIMLGYTNTLPANHDETTPPSLERQVEKVMWPFTEIIQFLEDPPTEIRPIEFLKFGIQLKSKLDMLARRAVDVEMENRIQWKNQGILENQKNDADKYRLLLGLTFRIDCLESTLAPEENFKGKQRSERWSKIFSLKTPAVKSFKKKVEDAGMTEVAFAKCIERLCNERNNRAGHAKITLPKIVDEKTIAGALAIMEITDDKPVIETIKIIVAPVEDLDLITTKTSKKP